MEERYDNEAIEKVERITREKNGVESFEAAADEKAELRRNEAISDRKERMKERGNDKGKKKKKDGYGGWLAAVVGLSFAVLVLGTLLMIRTVSPEGEHDSGKTAERSFYNFSEYVGEMDNDLDKLLVSNDKKTQQKLLTKIEKSAALAEENLCNLPLKDESRFYTSKFVNQVGDYANYLNNRLIDGFSVTQTDKENLENVYEINKTLKTELNGLMSEMGADFDFSTLSDEVGGDNIVLSKFDELEANAVDYPKLIYDGPFSDALDKNSEPEGLKGEEIGLAEARAVFEKTFKKEGIGDITEDGETDGKIKTFNFKAKSEGGNEIYASVSKAGGKLVSFNYFADCSKNNCDLTECVEIATEYIASLGIEDMKPVWATEAGAKAYINFAYEKDGVIVYNDMIKATVCKERRLVSNLDAREYYLNHKERNIGKAKITAKEAKKKLTSDLEVESVRMAFIPYGEKNEILAYEFAGTSRGATYYIYVDANTGREAQIFRVVETIEGKLLV